MNQEEAILCWFPELRRVKFIELWAAQGRQEECLRKPAGPYTALALFTAHLTVSLH